MPRLPERPAHTEVVSGAPCARRPRETEAHLEAASGAPRARRARVVASSCASRVAERTGRETEAHIEAASGVPSVRGSRVVASPCAPRAACHDDAPGQTEAPAHNDAPVTSGAPRARRAREDESSSAPCAAQPADVPRQNETPAHIEVAPGGPRARRPCDDERTCTGAPRDVDSQLPAKRARRPGVTEMTPVAGATGPADAPEQMPDTQGPQSPDRDDPSSVSADSSSTTDAGPRARAARALQTTHSGEDALEEAYMVPDDAVEDAHGVPGAEEDSPGADVRDDTSDAVPGARAHAAARGERRRVLRGRGRAHARDPIPAMDAGGTAARDDSPHAPRDGAANNAGVRRRSARAAARSMRHRVCRGRAPSHERAQSLPPPGRRRRAAPHEGVSDGNEDMGPDTRDVASECTREGPQDAREDAARARILASRRAREARTRDALRDQRRDVQGHHCYTSEGVLAVEPPRHVRLRTRFQAAVAFRQNVDNAARPRPCAVCARLTPVAVRELPPPRRRVRRDAPPVASDAPSASEPATDGEESSDREMRPQPRRTVRPVPLRAIDVWMLVPTHEWGHRVPWGELTMPNPVWAEDRGIPIPTHVALLREALQDGASGGTRAWICSECMAALGRRRVPYAALAHFDPGLVPPDLPELTELEKRLLQDAWQLDYVVPIGHVGGEAGGCGLRGNVCAVLKPPVRDIVGAIAGVVPRPLSELRNSIHVEIVGKVDNPQALRSGARATRPLTGSVAKLLRWAAFLARTQPDRYRLDPRYVSQEELDACIGEIIDRAVDGAIDLQRRVAAGAVIRGRPPPAPAAMPPGSHAWGAAGGPDDCDVHIRSTACLALDDIAEAARRNRDLAATVGDLSRFQGLVAEVAHIAAEMPGGPRAETPRPAAVAGISSGPRVSSPRPAIPPATQGDDVPRVEESSAPADAGQGDDAPRVQESSLASDPGTPDASSNGRPATPDATRGNDAPRIEECAAPAVPGAPVAMRISLGSRVAIDEYDGVYFKRVFPWLFPFGEGLPPDRNFQRWAAVLLERVPRRFALDQGFIFVVCNMTLRHAWQARARMIVATGPGRVPALANATAEDAVEAVDTMAGRRTRNSASPAARGHRRCHSRSGERSARHAGGQAAST